MVSQGIETISEREVFICRGKEEIQKKIVDCPVYPTETQNRPTQYLLIIVHYVGMTTSQD